MIMGDVYVVFYTNGSGVAETDAMPLPEANDRVRTAAITWLDQQWIVRYDPNVGAKAWDDNRSQCYSCAIKSASFKRKAAHDG